jgi:carboxymethylenebutenolidase
MGTTIELTASDGHRPAAYRADPAGGLVVCDQRGSYDAAAAKLARERTLAFLRQHVG